MHMRPVAPSEASELLALMSAMQMDDGWQVPFDRDAAHEAVEGLLQNPTYGLAWFIEVDAHPVGYIVMSFDYSLEFGGRNAWIDEFFIQPDARGRGLGAKVLEFFDHAAREAGARAVHLGVSPGNRAINLYRRHGFRDNHGRILTKMLAR